MQRDRRFRVLAVCLSGTAGYVDAIGFLMTGGFFVSFMSGNTTRLGIGLAEGASSAIFAAGLVVTFVVGVMLGAIIGRIARSQKRAAVIGLVALLLSIGLLLHSRGLGVIAVTPMVLAMGAENTVFSEDGEVRIGLTYMTGTLVKVGKRLAAALLGGDRFDWVPPLLLWAGLLAGTVTGSIAFRTFGPGALGFAVAVLATLSLCTALAATAGTMSSN